LLKQKNAKFFEHIFQLKPHKDKPSYASSSSHTQDCDDNEEIELKRSKRLEKNLNLVKIFLHFLLVMTLSLIKRLSPLRMLHTEQAINNELEFILSNHTQELVDLPSGTNPIGCK